MASATRSCTSDARRAACWTTTGWCSDGDGSGALRAGSSCCISVSSSGPTPPAAAGRRRKGLVGERPGCVGSEPLDHDGRRVVLQRAVLVVEHLLVQASQGLGG